MGDTENNRRNESKSNDPKTDGKPANSTDRVSKYSINIWGVVLSGIFGFILSVYLLLGWPFNNKERFHEIDIHPASADSTGVVRITEVLTKYGTELGSLTPRDEDDKKRISKKIDSVKNLLEKLELVKFGYLYNNADTQRFRGAKFSIKRDRLNSMIDAYPKIKELEMGYHNPDFSNKFFTIKNPVSIKKYSTSLEFFRKYQDFAFWAFIWILQMVMWFLMFPICFFLFGKIKQLNIESGTKNRRGKSFLIAGISLVVFCLFLYQGILDQFIITDTHFMRGFGLNLLIYAAFGYILSFFCFTGYLYIADYLHQLQQQFKEGTETLKNITASKKTEAGNDKEALSAIAASTEVKIQAESNESIKGQYQRAKKYFNFFFWITALVLSMLVLCTASLFQSVNSLEVFSFYRHLSGRNYLAGDLVYLYGGLHSIILLIFVLPARFKMTDLHMSIPELKEDSQDGKPSDIFKKFGKSLGEILVVSSPLLTSLLQNLLDL